MFRFNFFREILGLGLLTLMVAVIMLCVSANDMLIRETIPAAGSR